MKVIAKFNYEEKTYIFYIEENSYKILYGFLDSEENIVQLSNYDEIKMMRIIAKQIFISNDSNNYVKLGIIRYDNKIFNVMYDEISKMKFFYEITVSGYKLPSLEAAGFLMKKFNVFSLAIRDENSYGENLIDKRLLFKRIAKYMGKAIAITFLSLIVFSSTTAKADELDGSKGNSALFGEAMRTTFLYKIDDDNKITEIEPTKSSTEFSAQKIIDTIDSNEKLSLQEKEFMKGYLNILSKYSKYVDMDFLLNILANLDFQYTDGKNGTIDGNFDMVKIIMNFYSSRRFEDPKYSAKKHEGYHAISMEDANCSDLLSDAFIEGMTQVLTEESSWGTEKPDYRYIRQAAYMRMLCEILGDDAMMGSYITGDKKYIVDALCAIIPDKQKAYQLLSALDVDMICESPNYRNKDTKPEEYSPEITQNAKQEIFYGMNEYFMAMFGYPMTRDAIMMLYYNNVCEYDQRISLKIVGDTYENTDFYYPFLKGYFVNSFINEYPEATITVGHVVRSETEETIPHCVFEDIVINDENRKLLPIQVEKNTYMITVNNAVKQKG